MQNKDVYRCYNDLLKDFLINNGSRYFLVARDIVTNQKFYAFEKTIEFLNTLNKWEENNPKNKI
jgi:hypothetical protein